MQTNNLFIVIKNQGGMTEVANCYLQAFKAQKNSPSDYLLVIQDHLQDTEVIQNVHYLVLDKGFEFLISPQKYQEKKLALHHWMKEHRIEKILCDYVGWFFVRDYHAKIIADSHYLLARVIPLFPPDATLQEIMYAKKIRLEQELFSKASRIIANSEVTYKDIINYYPHKKDCLQIVCVKKCLEILSTKPRTQFQKKSVLFHGRFSFEKGNALLQQWPEESSIVLHLYSPSSAETQKMASKKNVVVHTWVTPQKLQQILLEHSFHLFPSIYEPWGLGLSKSLMTGAICLARNIADYHQQVLHQHNGFCVEMTENSPSTLFDIHQFIQNMTQEECERISHHAMEARLYEQDYFEQITQNLDF